MRGGGVLWCAGVLAAVVGGCARPPVGGGGPPPPPPPGRVGPVAFDTFVQDRPAIAGKWYDYDPSTHLVTPKPQAWIVRDDAGGTARFAAFRIVSEYDENTAESGVFTLSVATFSGGAWSSEAPYVTSQNIKTVGPVCVDLFTSTEKDCAGDGWQLRLAVFQYFSPLAGIAVQDPGIFVRSVDGTDAFGAVSIARLDAADLTALPDPSTLADLDDAAPASFDSTDWDFAKLAPDLPRAGMAIGSRFGGDDVWWLMTQRYSLVRLKLGAVQDGKLHVTFSAADVDRGDDSAPDTFPDDSAADVDVPAVGGATWLTFTQPDLAVPAADLDGVEYPFAPPKNAKWDLALVQPAAGDVRVLLSPDACALDATQLGLDETTPPVDTP